MGLRYLSDDGLEGLEFDSAIPWDDDVNITSLPDEGNGDYQDIDQEWFADDYVPPTSRVVGSNNIDIDGSFNQQQEERPQVTRIKPKSMLERIIEARQGIPQDAPQQNVEGDMQGREVAQERPDAHFVKQRLGDFAALQALNTEGMNIDRAAFEGVSAEQQAELDAADLGRNVDREVGAYNAMGSGTNTLLDQLGRARGDRQQKSQQQLGTIGNIAKLKQGQESMVNRLQAAMAEAQQSDINSRMKASQSIDSNVLRVLPKLLEAEAVTGEDVKGEVLKQLLRARQLRQGL